MKLPMIIKVNFVSAWKFIKKVFKWRRQHIVDSRDGLPSVPKRALFFAINDYKGSSSDLRGCVNDQKNFIARLNKDFKGFDIRAFVDSEVTIIRFLTEVNAAIKALRPGYGDQLLIHYSGHGTQVEDKHGDESDGYDEALYLYDGVVIDDDIGLALRSVPEDATVILMFDSCFSGTVTRHLGGADSKNRFLPILDYKIDSVKRIRIPREEMKYVVISGCGEHQTSADAFINGSYNGAFTYYALHALKKGMSYEEWVKEIIDHLAEEGYDQVPTIEGKSTLINKQVFI